MALLCRLFRMIVFVAFADRGEKLLVLPDGDLDGIDIKSRQEDGLTVLEVELPGRNSDRTSNGGRDNRLPLHQAGQLILVIVSNVSDQTGHDHCQPVMRYPAESRFPFASLSMFGDQVQNLGVSALADFQRFKESSLALFFRKLRLSLGNTFVQHPGRFENDTGGICRQGSRNSRRNSVSQIEPSNSPANHLIDGFLTDQTADDGVQYLTAPHIEISLSISLPNDDRRTDPSQASDLNDMLELKMLDFPGKTNALFLSHAAQEFKLRQ